MAPFNDCAQHYIKFTALLSLDEAVASGAVFVVGRTEGNAFGTSSKTIRDGPYVSMESY